MFWFRKNKAPKLKSKRVGEARFAGKKKKLVERKGVCKFPNRLHKMLFGKNANKGLVYIGDLEELECESPEEPKFNAYNLVKSKKSPAVVSTGKGECVLVISADKIKKMKRSEDVGKKIKDAVDLHTAFHGTEPEEIKSININAPEKLIFVGHLNYIVYDVPSYSERRGVPFIHEARDRGDNVPKSKEKPIVCISPSKDFLVMYGPQFEFTERGIIG
jgi:hypothetical protein